MALVLCFFFFSSRRRHTIFSRDWSSDVCSSDLAIEAGEHERPYDTPLLGGLVPRGPAGRTGRTDRTGRPGQSAASGRADGLAETAAQAGVPANRSTDDEVIAEALM